MSKLKTLNIIKLLIVLIAICILVLMYIIFLNVDNVVYENIVSNVDVSSDSISIWLETSRGTGIYEMSDNSKWPGSGYKFNEELSYCENGSSLIWNTDNTVTVSTSLSDLCWIYFDVVPDVAVSTNNTNNSVYSATTAATLSCDDETGSYNQLYHAIEISSIMDGYTSCTLTYSEVDNKSYLNDYISSLAGMASGDGAIVDEGEIVVENYNNSTALSESDYGSTTQYYTSLLSSSSGTDTSVYSYSSSVWSVDSSSVTSGRYYHLTSSISVDGYYQVCYTLGSGHTSNRFYVYVDGTAQYLDGTNAFVYASTSDSQSDCYTLGYLSSGTSIRFVDRVYSSSSYGIAELSFYIQKAEEVDAGNAGIRYEGKNPNNYVWFNDELWRVIGVFDEDTHGVSGKYLTKIIKADVLDGLAYDSSNSNDWSMSSLNSLLNNYYYNALDGTSSGYCYGYSNITANCDYSVSGIKSIYRGMIEKTIWYLGGYSSADINVFNFFYYERTGSYVASGNATSSSGYIGLMYASDYGFSVLASSCDRTTELGSYNTNSCAGESWLYGKSYEWTITPLSNSYTSIFNIYATGYLYRYYAYDGDSVRPVLYLSEDVYIIDGTGTISDPYVLGI